MNEINNKDSTDRTNIEPASYSRLNPDTHRLFEKIKNGDELAFTEYYKRYCDSIVRFLCRLTGDEEEAKEITQEVFAVLWENRSTLVPTKTLEGVVYGTARNMAAMSLRRKKIHHKYSSHYYFTSREESYSVEEESIAEETASLLKSALGKLEPRQRKVFVAYRFEGKAMRDIAAEMGITYESARTYMKEASKSLKKILKVTVIMMILQGWHQ